MNWDQVEGRWTEMKGKARASWGELTDDELDQIDGKREQLVGKLQQKYGLVREEAERKADEWANAL
ncbi:CsbD family protein [Vreelandella gomseomensis]|uniref:CsbD family protein n=1 Tax=Vreelandella gomseomensis TaxID=370766 RepID=A0ABU1G761_9GAMM|nr:CsbD family protein [Halomonas gomseomensis]MDR5873337.1 CsbD family protein [Halomonas gomseomensis]